MSCLPPQTGTHLLPPKPLRSGAITRHGDPGVSSPLGTNPSYSGIFTKQQRGCRVADQGCIWRKINLQRIPREREILIKCRKDRWWGNAVERRETQVWREYSQHLHEVKTHGPEFTRTCPSHGIRVVPTHSPRGVGGNLIALVLLVSFGSIKIAAGNNWWCPLMMNG